MVEKTILKTLLALVAVGASVASQAGVQTSADADEDTVLSGSLSSESAATETVIMSSSSPWFLTTQGAIASDKVDLSDARLQARLLANAVDFIDNKKIDSADNSLVVLSAGMQIPMDKIAKAIVSLDDRGEVADLSAIRTEAAKIK